jgi:hypothetical protein
MKRRVGNSEREPAETHTARAIQVVAGIASERSQEAEDFLIKRLGKKREWWGVATFVSLVFSAFFNLVANGLSDDAKRLAFESSVHIGDITILSGKAIALLKAASVLETAAYGVSFITLVCLLLYLYYRRKHKRAKRAKTRSMRTSPRGITEAPADPPGR